MMNYWWVTRPKRDLSSIPELLGSVICSYLDKEWTGSHASHLSFEEELEKCGIKRKGDRRDQGGGGGRTYLAWLKSLGLVFDYGPHNILKPTLAGEALLSGKSPTEVLTKQVLSYQFPSAYSLGRNVQVSSHFAIRPFRFLLRLLLDSRINHLTEEEIAKIVAVEAVNESKKCYEHVVSRILQFREQGDKCLPSNFASLYASTKSKNPLKNLKDVANTMANWLSYTHFIGREKGVMEIPADKVEEVKLILEDGSELIKSPENQEKFQRQYGVDPWHKKDTRNLSGTSNITARQIGTIKIQQALWKIAAMEPIQKITSQIVETIASSTGYNKDFVEETLQNACKSGALDPFYSAYSQMAMNGQEECQEFEIATSKLFETCFGFKSEHVGPKGKTPDVLVVSDSEGYEAIIDNKAYHKYSITNDHKNRMCVNYIDGRHNYSDYKYPLAFFSYIAGGFIKNISSQISEISKEKGVCGSAITADTLISLCRKQSETPFSHADLRTIFSVNRRISVSDFELPLK